MSTLKQRFAELATDHPEITQAKLARETGAKPPSVHGWFSGDTKSMKAGTAAKAAKLYGVEPGWLATGEGPKFAKQAPTAQASEGEIETHSPGDSMEPSLAHWRAVADAVAQHLGEMPVVPASFIELVDAIVADAIPEPVSEMEISSEVQRYLMKLSIKSLTHA